MRALPGSQSSLHDLKLHSGLGASAVQLLSATLSFCSVRGTSVCPNGAFIGLSQLQPLKRCAVARALRSRRGGRGRQKEPLEAKHLRRRPGSPSGFKAHPAPGHRVFSKSGPSNGARDLAGREQSRQGRRTSVICQTSQLPTGGRNRNQALQEVKPFGRGKVFRPRLTLGTSQETGRLGNTTSETQEKQPAALFGAHLCFPRLATSGLVTCRFSAILCSRLLRTEHL